MRRRKKRKFIKPKTGLKPMGPVKQIGHAGVRFHKGYVYDKLRYSVLTLSQMSQVDKDFASSFLKTITTGPEILVLPTAENGWSVKPLDMNGKAYVVSYKGIEVAVYFKRQLHTMDLYPGDRFPEGVLQDPLDAWQRLDLIGPSAKKANVLAINEKKKLQEENKALREQVVTLKALNDKLDSSYRKRVKRRR